MKIQPSGIAIPIFAGGGGAGVIGTTSTSESSGSGGAFCSISVWKASSGILSMLVVALDAVTSQPPPSPAAGLGQFDAILSTPKPVKICVGNASVPNACCVHATSALTNTV